MIRKENMPESQLVVSIQSPEEQLQSLRTYLATSEPFRHCRGKFGNDWTGTGMFREFEDASPTAILDQFDWRSSQIRVLMNHLAKLRRDGQLVAFEELSRALIDRSFVITGEELPLDKRHFGVLLMYSPERMLDFIRWLKLVSPQIVDLQLGYPGSHVEEFIKRGLRKDRPGFKEWTLSILEQHPEIRSGLEAFYERFPSGLRSECDRGRFLPDRILSDYLKEFPKDEASRDKLCRAGRWLRPEEDNRYTNTDVLGNWAVACFFPQMTQQEVLSLVKRERQHQVATWQFHYPAHMMNFDGYTASIGLFPEKELGHFSAMWPSFVSTSLSHGMGAVIMEHRHQMDMTDPLFDRKRWRDQETEPDKNEVGLKLHFLKYE
jgi:hypothetical protein